MLAVSFITLPKALLEHSITIVSGLLSNRCHSGNQSERGGTVVGCWGLRLPPLEFGNIVPGDFTPVLGKHISNVRRSNMRRRSRRAEAEKTRPVYG